MREGEPAYWDSVAEKVSHRSGFYDNWSKRRLLGQWLLKCGWGNQKVLEIGVGAGATAALLALSCGNRWDYIGTDVSPKFIMIARQFGLNVIQADVLHLPEGEFTRILALDSLEHVHPDDREEGYKNVASRLAKDGLLFINMPHNRSLHDDQFDHGIELGDLVRLEGFGLRLHKYEYYEVAYLDCLRGYGFVVMTK